MTTTNEPNQSGPSRSSLNALAGEVGWQRGISQSVRVTEAYRPAAPAPRASWWKRFTGEHVRGLLFVLISSLFILAVPRIALRKGEAAAAMGRVIKRGIDIIGAIVGLILTLPIWIILPVIIKLDSRGPVFYTQIRVGQNRRGNQRRFVNRVDSDNRRARERRRSDYHGHLFRVIKFRTMVNNAERDSGPVWATEDDPRITRLGAFMRKSRLDEIPQFINVLCGDMSLVGPRPERPNFVDEFCEEFPQYGRRLEMKPGLTGLAQVQTGYDFSKASVLTKLKFDLDYIDNWSVWQDIKIMIRTVGVVLTGRGAR